ncbi:hypothetical protein C8R47DRAFT_1231301 [Mycena vitilis]|nr:hypothetical protein C8R47DRAFT_1231301 [Mycena vitilis]
MCPRRWSPPTARPPPPAHRLAAACSPLLLINMAITIALALGADGGRDERRGPNLLKIRRCAREGRQGAGGTNAAHCIREGHDRDGGAVGKAAVGQNLLNVTWFDLGDPNLEVGVELAAASQDVSRAHLLRAAAYIILIIDTARGLLLGSFTSPDTPPNLYPEGFQGNFIPVDAAAVGRLCVDRLTLSFEKDD